MVLSSFLLCFLSFNLIISNGGISFRSDNDGFVCWRLSSQINPHSSSWVSAMGIASQSYVLGYGNETFGMYSIEDQAVPSFLLYFPFVSLFPWTLHLNRHIATFPSLKLCTLHIAMPLACYCCISFSSFSSSSSSHLTCYCCIFIS